MFCICFAIVLASLHVWRAERYDKYLSVERGRLEAQLQSYGSELAADVGSKSAARVQKTLGRIVQQHELQRLELVAYDGRMFVRDGVPPRRFAKSVEQVIPIAKGKTKLASIIATKSIPAFSENSLLIGLSVVALFGLLFFSFWMLRRMVREKVILPIDSLIRSMASGAEVSEEMRTNFSKAPGDVRELFDRFETMSGDLHKYHSRLVEAEREAQYVATASQVAHDIRSPLAALVSVNEDLGGISEQKRMVLRSAVDRIQDIANHLLESSRKKRKAPPGDRSGESGLLSATVEELISEKRFRLRSHLDVRILSQISNEAFGVFVRMETLKIKRVLSNLLDNAIEAIQGKGSIRVNLDVKNGFAELVIEDDGSGIAPEVLPKLMLRGATFGKPEGTGLGLYHAKKSIEEAKGRLSLSSALGVGTKVAIALPVSPAPDWFAACLELGSVSRVVVLDDDSSIHHLWRARYLDVDSRSPGTTWCHLHSEPEFREWCTDELAQVASDQNLFLVDYELIGSPSSGLDLIEAFSLHRQSVLVTSRHEDPQVRERARKMGVRILPKILSGSVPIVFGRADGAGDAVVLIDDDVLVRQAWKMAGARRGRKVYAYSNLAEFTEAAPSLPKNLPIYIDLDLGEAQNGIEVARRLHAQGYLALYLATGHVDTDVSAYRWIRGVVGKAPFGA